MLRTNKNVIHGTVKFIVPLFIAVLIVLSCSAKGAENKYGKEYFNGMWKTESGSTYEYNNGAMICRSVHDPNYNGWINKSAIEKIRLENNEWVADQAIRFHDTGKFRRWLVAEIKIVNENKFTKTVIKPKEEGAGKYRPQIWDRITK